MSTLLAHPQNEVQEKAVKAILEALQVPYEIEPVIDETTYLLSTESNRTILLNSVHNAEQGNGKKITLDEIWK